ncbi:DUF4870 domain-containing protein [Chloroflexota bacterium]
MELSPEERRKIYEEEKAKMEAEQEKQAHETESTTGLTENVAGLLCYLGAWVTGIVFLVIEQKNKFVRFHAIQSIVVFGALTVASAMLSWIPIVGGFFGAAIGITAFVLWLVLMIRAYQGELFKIPIAGEIAMGIFSAVDKGSRTETDTKPGSKESVSNESKETTASVVSKRTQEVGKRIEEYFTASRAARITGYSFAIFWNVSIFIFLAFFYKYIAWYATEPDGSVTRLSMLNNDYLAWLPIFITVTILSIVAYITLIIYDKYWFREAVQIFISIIGLVSTVSLVSIFPFDFSVIPNATAVDVVPMVVTAVLIFIAVAMGVTVLVRTAKLISLATNQDRC